VAPRESVQLVTGQDTLSAPERRLLGRCRCTRSPRCTGRTGRVTDPDMACAAALLHDTVEDHAGDIAPGGSRQDALEVLTGQSGHGGEYG
jgi:hypothetical protein